MKQNARSVHCTHDLNIIIVCIYARVCVSVGVRVCRSRMSTRSQTVVFVIGTYISFKKRVRMTCT